MPLIDRTASRLLLIDFQARLMPAISESGAVLANALRLAEAARLLSVPTLRTEQYPKGLGPTLPDLAAFGPCIEKTTFSSCGAAAFLAAIAGDHTLVVAGCEAHVCVLQTVIDLLTLGRRVVVVADAVGTRAALSKAMALERMRDHGADIVTTEMVVFEWLQRADIPEFKAVSALIR